jgi:hypothetical protein
VRPPAARRDAPCTAKSSTAREIYLFVGGRGQGSSSEIEAKSGPKLPRAGTQPLGQQRQGRNHAVTGLLCNSISAELHTALEAEPVPANCTCAKIGIIIIALKLLAIITFASDGAG